MSRNRKHQTAVVRFGPAIKALSLCLFLGSSGIGYVFQKQQINSLAERWKQTEIRLEQLHRQNERLARVLAMLQSPGEIEARIKRIDLGLVAPEPDQIVRLQELPAGAETLRAPQQARETSQPAKQGGAWRPSPTAARREFAVNR